MPEKPHLLPAIKDLVFIHIPKTAGTSLRNALVKALPDHTRLFDYSGGNAIAGDFIDAAKSRLVRAADIVAWRERAEPGRGVFVCGHVAVRKYIAAFHPASFVAFLRDPVERLVSSYQHHVRFHGFTGSFADFYVLPEHINSQSRMLWGVDLRNIGFIGLTEFMPDMIAALSRHLGAPLDVQKENVGQPADRPEVDGSVRAHIHALNDDDVRLYQHVKANLDDYTNFRRRSEARPLIARGVVAASDGRFEGHVTTSEPGRLAEIEVRSGNEVLHRCYADEFRSFRDDRKAAKSGAWGFSVALPAAMLGAHKQLRFVLAGTGTELAGSPVSIGGSIAAAAE